MISTSVELPKSKSVSVSVRAFTTQLLQRVTVTWPGGSEAVFETDAEATQDEPQFAGTSTFQTGPNGGEATVKVEHSPVGSDDWSSALGLKTESLTGTIKARVSSEDAVQPDMRANEDWNDSVTEFSW